MIGSVWGSPALVVVDTLIGTPRPSNFSPLPQTPLYTPQELWERLVARSMSLAEGSWLQGFAFECIPSTVLPDGSRVTHPLMRVVADREGTWLLMPRRALRATADTVRLADGRYGTWLRCPRSAQPSGINYYNMILDECFRGTNRCCPTLFTPFASGQPATVSVRFVVDDDSVRCTIFTQLLAPAGRSCHADTMHRDTLRVCYNHRMGVVTWIERIPEGAGAPREHFELTDWHRTSLPYTPAFIAERLDRGRAEAEGFRCYELPYECPLWLSRQPFHNRVLTGPVAQHPLVGVDGDTVRLADDQGWRLVVLWDYGCPGWEQLRQSMELPARAGSMATRLEAAGISLYAVNPFGGCTEDFRDYAGRTLLQHSLYAAQDFTLMDSRRLPAAYLYRPDGRLACALTGDQCSLDIIINAKQNKQ